jgi:3-oxoacyl-[acyl-carrier-protein] synthase II
MTWPDLLVTGFSSIGAGGASAGLPDPAVRTSPELITGWTTPGPRRAVLVPPFRPADVVPGLRTRRLDRLSVWALVGTALALQDAGVDHTAVDGDRSAVVFGTAFGCLELTEQFLGGLRLNAAHADPILFPETLSNQPGSHVARHFGFRGPNLTVSAGMASSETALLEAASLLRNGEADCAVVFAGDLLTRSLFAWYEAAGRLASLCSGGAGRAGGGDGTGTVPGEGLVACVMETREFAERRRAKPYGRYLGGWVGPDGEAAPSPGVRDVSALLLRVAPGINPDDVELMASPSAVHADVAGGAFGGCGLLRLGFALGQLRESDRRCVMVASNADCGQFGVLLVEKDPS